ncbi:LLM class flavin-dependent oxidoreductase [Kineococcus gynurae]|uniref:LLM class flavin-dependent oxidoreductase n=1 Tax=Kineococcus gynurae TaxID=452979 RepID=A0ABV5LNZ7_9ACTN
MVDAALLLPRDLPGDRVREYARAAEDGGFSELWVVEDLGFAGGIAQAAAILAATEQLRVGLGILPVGARNLGFAAMEVASLAGMFPGRLVCGIGHGMPGWMRQVGAWPASPLRALEDYLVGLRALLRGETVSGGGLREVRLEAPPAVVPPVLAGVRGPRSLALAGRVADGVVLAEPASPVYLAEVRAACGEVGPEFAVVAFDVAAVGEDGAAARQRVRPALEWIGEPDWAPHVRPLPFGAELAELRAASPDRAAFAAALPDAWVRALTAAGTPEELRERVGALGAAGATTVVLLPADPDARAALPGLAAAATGRDGQRSRTL